MSEFGSATEARREQFTREYPVAQIGIALKETVEIDTHSIDEAIFEAETAGVNTDRVA